MNSMYVICIEHKDFSRHYVSGFDVAQGEVSITKLGDAAEFGTITEVRDTLNVIRPIILEKWPQSEIYVDEV